MDARKQEGFNPKSIGENSEGQFLAKMLMMGKTVLVPFGDNQRYDFVTEEDGKFIRVQCKTARLKGGKVVFPASSSSYHRGGKRKDYKGQADIFGVYCPETGAFYWVPVNESPTSECTLRIDPPKNGEKTRTRWAKDFEI